MLEKTGAPCFTIKEVGSQMINVFEDRFTKMEEGGMKGMKSGSKYGIIEGHKVRQYDIKTSNIPRYDFFDPECSKLISDQKPVMITGSGLVEPAMKWDLDYLQENLGDASNSVLLSDDEMFMYFDEKRCRDQYADFKPPVQKLNLPFSEVCNLIKLWKPGKKRIYMQQALTSSVSDKIVRDFVGFNWKWLARQQMGNGWGGLTSNLLLVGLPGNITPLHFDEQENFFAQTRGLKRCILFPPEQFKCFYPFPYHHPCDRQSQVKLDNPDYNRFPLLEKAVGLEAIIHPGEVLYIPIYWWHYVESVEDAGPTISITFWYKAASNSSKGVSFPLEMNQKIGIMRNIEKLLGNAVGDQDEIGCLLNTIVNGRYPQDSKYLEI